MMRKLRAGALLGGLTLVAVLLLAGLVRAQLIGPFSHQYLQTVKKACADAVIVPRPSEGGSITTECLAFVDFLDKASGDSVADFAAPLARAALKFFKIKDKEEKVKDTCEACVQSTQDFESLLAGNGTARGLRETFITACIDEFEDPAAQDACVATASDIEPFIDHLLANFPPVPLCQEANICPR